MLQDIQGVRRIYVMGPGSRRARFERSILTTGNCLRCLRPWKQTKTKDLGFWSGVHHSRHLNKQVWWGHLGVEPHSTRYRQRSGCFPLCQTCWEELGTAEARVPFYRDLFERWERDHPVDWDDWIGCLLGLIEEELHA